MYQLVLDLQVTMGMSKDIALYCAWLCSIAIYELLKEPSMHNDECIVQTWLHVTECMARSVRLRKIANRRRGHEHRQAWAYPRPQGFVKCYLLSAYSASMFKRRLRVSKETFHYLCGSLAPFMQKKTTNFRVPVSIEDRVAIALSRLATGDGLLGLGDTYGCAKSTCCEIILAFSKAIVKSGLRNMYIRWPSRSRLATLAREFEALRGIPQKESGCVTERVSHQGVERARYARDDGP